MIRWLLEKAVRVAILVTGFATVGRALKTRRQEDTAGAASTPTGWWHLMRGWMLPAAALAAAGALLAGLVVVSGVVPLKASGGHWAITESLLQFAKRRSIATHTLAVRVPALDDPSLVVKGAGHYDLACRPCHGSPSLQQPRVAAYMLPQPPDLRESVRTYGPSELFYIVKHGLKFTGMPAWPTQQRDDEVWAMVAFLGALPGMHPGEYQRLVDPGDTAADAGIPMGDLAGPEEVPKAIRESCSRCHGAVGTGRGTGAFPKLAGQRREYLYASLVAYARGERQSGIMAPVAAALEESEIRQVAGYYAGLAPGAPTARASSPGDVELGRAIAERGLPNQLVPACRECHGPGNRPRNPVYPVLAGQYADYLVLQLSLFKSGHRGGTPYQDIMRRVAGGLQEDQMRAVAAYFASLGDAPPRPPEARRPD